MTIATEITKYNITPIYIQSMRLKGVNKNRLDRHTSNTKMQLLRTTTPYRASILQGYMQTKTKKVRWQFKVTEARGIKLKHKKYINVLIRYIYLLSVGSRGRCSKDSHSSNLSSKMNTPPRSEAPSPSWSPISPLQPSTEPSEPNKNLLGDIMKLSGIYSPRRDALNPGIARHTQSTSCLLYTSPSPRD